MDDQEISGGFCFRCAVPASTPEAATQQSQNLQVTQLQNPWPLLAARPTLGTVRTNPLIHAVYFHQRIGNTFTELHEKLRNKPKDAQPTDKDDEDVKNVILTTHEWNHLVYMNWTPAKDLARMTLACCYMYISELLSFASAGPYKLNEIVDIWKELELYTQELQQIMDSIEFIEELCVNAWTFQTLELLFHQYMWAGYKEILKKWREKVLDIEELNCPGYRKIYKNIQPLVLLMMVHPRFALVMRMLLESIDERDSSKAADGYEILRKILEQPYIKKVKSRLQRSKARSLESIDDINKHLENVHNLAVDKDYDEFEKYVYELFKVQRALWEHTLALQLHIGWNSEQLWGEFPPSLQLFNPPIPYLLWNITYGNGNWPEINSSHDAEMLAAHTIASTIENRTKSRGPHAISYAVLSCIENEIDQDCIVIDMFGGLDPTVNTKKTQDDHRHILFFEGLRQQLRTKQGLVCPHSQGSHTCKCPQKVRDTLEQLYYLAKVKLFGPGDWPEWKPLPCHRSNIWLPY